MCGSNQTIFHEFILLGFHDYQQIELLLFCLYLVVYILILVENGFIVTLVSTCHHLNVPMYIFLRNLALADLLLTSTIIPQLLNVMWLKWTKISKMSCFIQFFFYSVAICSQSLILTTMAFDRYLAICLPLRYSALMNQKLCFHLSFWPWAFGAILMQREMFLIGQLEFCDTDEIDHFFCDLSPILLMASTDTSAVASEDFNLSVLMGFIPFILIIISYMCIFVAILKITSNTGRRKAFSMCSSHLTLVCAHYGPLIALYLFPAVGNTPYENKLKSLVYTAFTPLVNPILYSMRNKEIKKASKLLFCKTREKITP